MEPVIEERIDIETDDGAMTTFVFHPDVDGPHPVVLYLMDAPGIRPALRDMASRLATAGYYVLLPYLYHRGGPYREFTASDEDLHARRDLMATVTPAGIVTDAAALIAHADADPAAAVGPVGVVGFCMSGGMALVVARAFPERVRAAASIHGAWLVRDGDDSPHRGLDALRAEVHLAWVEDDPTAPPEQRAEMLAALDEADVPYTIDVVTDAVHGFAPPGERYDRTASERHWERVHSLLRRRL
jgi:carboxymethylenebutenolidase